MSSSSCLRMANGRSKVTRVAIPSAKVSHRSPTTREAPFQDRAKASARSACTPMTFARLPSPVRVIAQPQAPLPPPIGTRMTSVSGCASKISSP